jgi:glycerol uptake facilitator-like aquaporin
MQKIYPDRELKEIHGEEIDILGHNQTSYQNPEAVNLNVQNKEEYKKRNKKLQDVGSYGYTDLMKAFAVEFVACVYFMLLENYTAGNIYIFIFGLWVLLTTLYPVSGCNMNGSVSLALWYYEEEFVPVHLWRRFVYILVLQPFALFVGMMLSLGVVGPQLIYIVPKDSEPFKIAFCEFIWTGSVIFIALHCIVCTRTRPFRDIGLNFAFFIAFLYFAILAGKPISGGSYNPTKYLITQAIAYQRGIEPNAFKNWYCYIFPQYLGTVVFTCLFKYVWEPIYDRKWHLKLKWEKSFFTPKYIEN